MNKILNSDAGLHALGAGPEWARVHEALFRFRTVSKLISQQEYLISYSCDLGYAVFVKGSWLLALARLSRSRKNDLVIF